MASSLASCITQFSLLLFFFISFSNAQLPSSTSRPASIVFELDRDPLTLQYMIKINQGTPRADIKLTLDLGGKLPWLRCHKGYMSSSYRPVKCKSPQCSLASKPVSCVSCNDTKLKTTQCHNNACRIYTSNPVTQSISSGELISDVVTVKSEDVYTIDDGYIISPDMEFSKPGPIVTPRRFTFGCATASNGLRGLAKGAAGVAGIGRSSGLSLVSQFSAAFGLSRIFALELYRSSGTIYFGGGFYVTLNYMMGVIYKRCLTYTPLLINQRRREEYFIDVRSVMIHSKTVLISKKLLSINKETGVGGTKIDMRIPYTMLETSIYRAFVKVHTEWAQGMNVSRVASVAPFSACYSSSTIPWTTIGNPEPPTVELNFPKNVYWNIVKDLVWVNDGVHCLAFVDGGSNPTTSIVIGAHQMGFIEFDISRARVGFEGPRWIT
ncbi:basic 7S globulin-like [Papaver somniferum]|uniref:basic 7S globulin-like n=1 Tax=Papaver somniferum TaxID=3469 RepID=UPI000E70203B|nr:basic 7S globulin-like [Papaver somniferum]